MEVLCRWKGKKMRVTKPAAEIQGKRNARLSQKNIVQGAQEKSTKQIDPTESHELPQEPQSQTTTPEKIEQKQSSLETPPYTELDESGVEIKTSTDKGRGLWATKSIRPGTPILKLKPHVYCISRKLLNTTCSFCAREGEVRRCTKCLKIAYCSTVCQKEDWRAHKEECKALVKWARRAPSESVSIPADIIRVVGRTIWLRKSNGSDSVWWRQIESMQANKEMFGTSKDSYIHMIHGIGLYLMGGDREFTKDDFNSIGLESPNEFISLWSQYTSNSFTLTSPTLSALGVAISPLAALINHSCNPNAVVVFPKCKQGSPPILNVVSIKPIAPGEEILASYIDITLPKQVRQQELLSTYSFVCKCDLCESWSSDQRQFYFCPLCRSRGDQSRAGNGGRSKKGKDGCLAYPSEYSTNKDAKPKPLLPNERTSRCTECGESVDLDPQTEDLIKAAGDGLAKAESMQYSDPNEALRYAFRLLSLLSNMMPTMSHPRLALSRLAQSLLLSQMQPDDKNIDQIIRISAQNRDALVQILHTGHPIRAIAAAEVGQLLCVDEPPISSEGDANMGAVGWPPRGYARLALARDFLLHAKTEAEIGFGSDGGQIADTVRESLVNITREMGVFKKGVKNAARTLEADA